MHGVSFATVQKFEAAMKIILNVIFNVNNKKSTNIQIFIFMFKVTFTRDRVNGLTYRRLQLAYGVVTIWADSKNWKVERSKILEHFQKMKEKLVTYNICKSDFQWMHNITFHHWKRKQAVVHFN